MRQPFKNSSTISKKKLFQNVLQGFSEIGTPSKKKIENSSEITSWSALKYLLGISFIANVEVMHLD